MRNAARVKLGYYPLPESEGARLRNLLVFPEEGASVLDPCVGTGAAINQLTEHANVFRHGVELDTGRARQARDAGIDTIGGNVFGTRGKTDSFSLLYLNPPYDSEIGSIDNQRMEYLFLDHTYRWLIQGGLLVMVIQHRQLQSCLPLLSAQFCSFRILQLTDPQSVRFDQIVLFAIRKRIAQEAFEGNRQALVEAIYRNPMPQLTGNEPKYQISPSPPTQLVYRGLPLDQLEDLAIRSSAWKKVSRFLLPKEEVTMERPITHLHAGHVSVLCTAGLLNGVFGEQQDRHIARWQIRKYVTTFIEKVEGYTEVHKQERFSNEVSLVYEDGRTLLLTDKRKGEQDGERLSEDGPA